MCVRWHAVGRMRSSLVSVARVPRPWLEAPSVMDCALTTVTAHTVTTVDSYPHPPNCTCPHRELPTCTPFTPQSTPTPNRDHADCATVFCSHRKPPPLIPPTFHVFPPDNGLHMWTCILCCTNQIAIW